jgi:hypothetical protein
VYPANAAAGATVTVNTTACGASRAAAGDASAVGAGTFTLAPGSQAKDAVGRFQVPPSAQPGTYEIVAKCSGGGQVTGDLMIALASSPDQVHPKGHVKTGVGGALGTDPVKTAAGVAALAIAGREAKESDGRRTDDLRCPSGPLVPLVPSSPGRTPSSGRERKAPPPISTWRSRCLRRAVA